MRKLILILLIAPFVVLGQSLVSKYVFTNTNWKKNYGTDLISGKNFTANDSANISSVQGVPYRGFHSGGVNTYLSYTPEILGNVRTRSYFITFKVISDPPSGTLVALCASALRTGTTETDLYLSYGWYNFTPYGGSNALCLVSYYVRQGVVIYCAQRLGSLNDGKWHTAVYEYGETSQVLALYLDGVLSASRGSTTGIGGNAGGNTSYMCATNNYADVGLAEWYDYELTTATVKNKHAYLKGFYQ